MRRAVALGAVVASVVLASSAGAAGPKSFDYRFPLPKVGTGSIYEVTLKMQLPPGATVSGNPFAFNLTNGTSLPPYIRAAYVVKATGGGVWDIFVAINALKTTKARLLAGTTTLDTTLQATPIGAGGSVISGTTHHDACKSLAAIAGGLAHAAYVIFVGENADEGSDIFKHTEAADKHCK